MSIEIILFGVIIVVLALDFVLKGIKRKKGMYAYFFPRNISENNNKIGRNKNKQHNGVKKYIASIGVTLRVFSKI